MSHLHYFEVVGWAYCPWESTCYDHVVPLLDESNEDGPVHYFVGEVVTPNEGAHCHGEDPSEDGHSLAGPQVRRNSQNGALWGLFLYLPGSEPAVGKHNYQSCFYVETGLNRTAWDCVFGWPHDVDALAVLVQVLLPVKHFLRFLLLNLLLKLFFHLEVPLDGVDLLLCLDDDRG